MSDYEEKELEQSSHACANCEHYAGGFCRVSGPPRPTERLRWGCYAFMQSVCSIYQLSYEVKRLQGRLTKSQTKLAQARRLLKKAGQPPKTGE